MPFVVGSEGNSIQRALVKLLVFNAYKRKLHIMVSCLLRSYYDCKLLSSARSHNSTASITLGCCLTATKHCFNPSFRPTEGNLTKPVMVLLDVRMPGMDGRECALKIQEMVKQCFGIM